MSHRRITQPHVEHQKQLATRQARKGISSGQLLFIGVASIMGAGFFLATATVMRETGPAILWGYLLGGGVVGTVFAALGEMLASDPGKGGSFKVYAEEYIGRGVGFVGGWMYLFAGVLIMSSEVTALGIFTQRWLPHLPLWMLSAVYAVLALGINWLGVRNFGRIESLFAAIKLGAVVGFIVLAVIFGWRLIFSPHPWAMTVTGWESAGLKGFWTSLIMIFFTYGGVAATGLASAELEDQRLIPWAFRRLVHLLVLLYVGSLALVVWLVPQQQISPQQSPFVTVLTLLHVPFADEVLNGVIITAAFSTMVAAMFSVTRILLSLAEDGEAPQKLLKVNRRGVPTRALLLSSAGLLAAIIMSYVLPKTVYELLTTSAGIILILKWGVVLWTHHHFRKTVHAGFGRMRGYPVRSGLTATVIGLVLLGCWWDPNHRISLYISLGIVACIAIVYGWARRRLTPRWDAPESS
ncbi:amino acid permease [Polycladomyces subterraneus]|uniref:Amino acid permease n=1 Tax=Polycladomyces subterraneus TaxID=1016997 RepID=A0ABT8INK4_9BACL|nr:amino acid permease [Polycladomyces subterraneus]MDN4594382.1 amino acid permease [Polycladomyces subterraneus]